MIVSQRALAALVIAVSLASPALAEEAKTVPQSRTEMQLSFAPLVKQTANAVVNVYAERVVERRSIFSGDPFFEEFFGQRMPNRSEKQSSLGSGVIVGNEDTLVALGPLNTAPPLLALAGFLLIAVLEARRIRGAILIGILAVTGAGWALGDVQYQGLVSLPPSLAPTFLQLDLPGLLHHDGGAPIAVLLQVVLVFVLVEVFDATGTLYGVVGRAGLLKLPGAQKRFGRALLADSTAIVAGSMLGTSSTTAFAESASGVQVGGRTGLTALVVSALFLAALLFSPLAAMVPSYATAPALLFVAGLMLRELVEVDWSDLTESVPAALCALAMPFTYSIANGLAFGFIAYAALKAGTGRWREVHPAVWLVAVLFTLRYALE